MSPALRIDLSAAPRWRRGNRWWIVHDPIGNVYYRLNDRDFSELAQRTASNVLTSQAVAAEMLSGVTRQATTSTRRNPLAIRLLDFPVDAVAARLARYSDWLMSPPAICVWLAVMLIAIFTVMVGWQRLTMQLPSFRQFVTVENALLMVAVTIMTKSIHELGHAVACKRWGGSVGDIGVMLLCGMPCLFCDVTDSWRFANRWGRAAVMAAGMYVEWVLAALATFGWWLTSDSWLNLLCLDLMFVCGVSTILFNGNPLGRYDGYFILCDVVDCPNLQAAAAYSWRTVVQSCLGQCFFSIRDLLLATYHLMGSAYRTVLTIVIGAWIARLLTSLYLTPLAIVLMAAAILTATIPWLISWRNWLTGRGAWSMIPRFQRFLVFGLIVCALIVTLGYERTVHVSTNGNVDLRDNSSVFVPPGGGCVVKVNFSVGEQVNCGDVLAMLQSPELELQHLELSARHEQLSTRLFGLQRRALTEPGLLEQAPQLEAAIHAAAKQLELTARQLESLSLIAPRSGIIFPPLEDSFSPNVERIGAVYTGGAGWCRIGGSQRKVARLRIDRDSLRHIGVDNAVHLTSATARHQVVSGKVMAILDTAESTNATAKEASEKKLQDHANPRTIEVWCELPDSANWHTGTQVWGWIEGVSEPLWRTFWQSVYRAIAP